MCSVATLSRIVPTDSGGNPMGKFDLFDFPCPGQHKPERGSARQTAGRKPNLILPASCSVPRPISAASLSGSCWPFIAAAGSIRDQTDWTGAASSDWFTAGNGNDGVLRLASVQVARHRLNCRSGALLATTALVAATTFAPDAAYAQTNWTGTFSPDWFLSENWDAGFPRQTTDANINTGTPYSTLITTPGALARNLSVGPNGTGVLTIQPGGTLANSFGSWAICQVGSAR